MWVFVLNVVSVTASFYFVDVRIEDFFYEKLEKKVPTRMNNHEMLGQSMMDSGNEFGPGTAYG